MTDKHIEERPLVGLGTIANWFNPPISIPTVRKVLKKKRINIFYVGRSISVFPSDLRNKLRENKQ